MRFGLQEAVFTAQSTRDARRDAALQDADAALNRLRLYLRLVHQWRWLSDGQYVHVSTRLQNWKIAGRWIKQSRR